MKREKKKLKMMALSAVLAVGMLLPMSAMAQYGKNENFFKGSGGGSRSSSTTFNVGTQNYGGGTLGGITVGSDNFGGGNLGGVTVEHEEFGAPLGSGILIMLAAGMGYIVIKRRRSE